MKTLRVNFVDFWNNFIKDDNVFFHTLSLKYNIIIDEINPDIVFFSVDYDKKGERFKYKNSLKIFYTGENVDPNWNEADVALTFRHTNDPREYRYPLWAMYINWFNRPYNEDRDQAYLKNINDLTSKPRELYKPRFCAFIATQPKGRRVLFVPKLCQYKVVDCSGPLFHNTDYYVTDTRGNIARGDQQYKIKWLQSYKFNVAMENSQTPGYATEKIMHSFFANTIPIYWGSETIEQDFNPDCFINWHNYKSDEATIEVIKEIDTDSKKYLNMLKEPFWIDNKIPDSVKPESLLAFLERFIR